MNGAPSTQHWLIASLQNPGFYDHPVRQIEVIETHISWIVLTGDVAYKIKKPVNFGFLDFSTLEKRRINCLEELRLNRRLAPHLYLDLVTCNGSVQRVALNGPGPVMEYAVKMVQFPQSAQLDRIASEDGLTGAIMAQLAGTVARFHRSIDSAPRASKWGCAANVRKVSAENFRHIRNCLDDPPLASRLERLERWNNRQIDAMAPFIDERKAHGYVRECHGDMHLRNIALWKEEIIIFDCIEFNRALRFIDVISEIAFLIMDLEARDEGPLASRFLNTYMQISGDYEGLRLLPFYKMYRALVRAKVDILRAFQEPDGSEERSQTVAEFHRYLDLADTYTRIPSPVLIINHGVSGTGKSTGAQLLADRMSAIQLKSDVERKRLCRDGLGSARENDIYTTEITEKTYDRLAALARALLKAGFSVIIDATNLKALQRQRFVSLATELGIRFFILSYTAPVEILRTRVEQRHLDGDDVSDATVDVLEHQLAAREPLSAEERLSTIEIHTEIPLDPDGIVRCLGSTRQVRHRG